MHIDVQLGLSCFYQKSAVSIIIKFFCFLNKLEEVKCESSKSFFDLMMPFTILLMNRDRNVTKHLLTRILDFLLFHNSRYHYKVFMRCKYNSPQHEGWVRIWVCSFMSFYNANPEAYVFYCIYTNSKTLH